MKLTFTPIRDTKSCIVYQHGDAHSAEHTTLYLKKLMLADAKIDPAKQITVEITES